MATHHLRARRRLGNRLREFREETGRTGAAFAGPLGWKQSKVSKIETGRQLPSEADVEAWAQAIDADPKELLALLDQARAEYLTVKDLYTAAGGADRLQDAITIQEATSKLLVKYQPAMIIGLLQTPDYAREILHLPSGPADSGGASEDEVARMIVARVRRQAILYEPGRDITLLMSEGALRTRVASPTTMREQLDHIARLAQTLTTATIGIVPFTAQAPITSLSGYAMYDDLVTIETLGGDLDIADPAEVARYHRYTKLLLDVAVTGPDAMRICRKAAVDLEADRP
ncbi:MAG: helix-turn-helix domain-containing protein [Streptomycetales bacterium]